MHLHAGVVEAGDRVHDLPAQLFELQRIVALEVGQEAGGSPLSADSPPPPSSPQPESPSSVTTSTMVRTNRPQCAPDAVAQRRLERHGDGGGLDIDDLKLLFLFRRAGDARQHAAIDAHGFAGHERGLVREQEGDDFGDLARLRAAAERVHGVDLFVERCGIGIEVDRPAQHRRFDRAGRDAEDAHAVRRLVHRHAGDEADQAVLGDE